MKCIVLILMLILLLLANCTLFRKNYTTVLEQKDDFVWQANYEGTAYKFEIVTVYDRIWYKGYLHISNLDSNRTYFLSGFQKGSSHPTTLKTITPDSTVLGFVMIWKLGQHADTLTVENNRSQGAGKLLPETMKLYKARK